MWWQIALVVVIELLAVGFLVRKLWPRPRILQRPDVRASDLVRKKPNLTRAADRRPPA
jgi:hypothetical protein